MAQIKSTMNLGTLVELPLEMCCKLAVDIECSENDELVIFNMYTTDANLKMYEKQSLSG